MSKEKAKEKTKKYGKGNSGGNEVDEEGLVEGKDVVLFYRGWPSQWYPAKFTCDETKRVFVNAEQYMMAEKARLFKDEVTEKAIMAATHPRLHKSLGRQVKNFDQKVWQENCSEIVYRGNVLKFSQNASLLQRLLATGDKTVAEASPDDLVWGIGLHITDPNALKQNKWRGQNLLGKALERTRNALRTTTTSNTAKETTFISVKACEKNPELAMAVGLVENRFGSDTNGEAGYHITTEALANCNELAAIVASSK